ncbi:MAG: hypothetical protein Q8Q88_22295 [Phenylobacterium sp.]|uniref:hypothetical protein n=1 Tax=Phenylobacterium sp. TaxID=1871053 RepID=UPI002733688D|nr:hypothetical protein [Phenylobacterium sp.]MDP3749770.1 hypothetical protein [Phenylobacterium sp.]
MADGSAFNRTEGQAGRRTFLVEATRGDGVLLRVLGPFAVQGAEIADLTATQGGGGVSIRLEVTGLSQVRAEHLAERLRALAAVTGVALGWRATA